MVFRDSRMQNQFHQSFPRGLMVEQHRMDNIESWGWHIKHALRVVSGKPQNGYSLVPMRSANYKHLSASDLTDFCFHERAYGIQLCFVGISA